VQSIKRLFRDVPVKCKKRNTLFHYGFAASRDIFAKRPTAGAAQGRNDVDTGRDGGKDPSPENHVVVGTDVDHSCQQIAHPWKISAANGSMDELLWTRKAAHTNFHMHCFPQEVSDRKARAEVAFKVIGSCL
jgi:hypothetical protein